jgi:type IV secretion system protein VirB11
MPGVEGLLSPLSPWLTDQTVSEIMINKPGEVFIENRLGINRHQVLALDKAHLNRLFTFISNEANQTLSEDSPLLSGNLYDLSRVQLVIPPTAKHYTLSIRRQSVKTLSLNDYRQSNFYATTRAYDINESAETFATDEDTELASLYHAGQFADFMESAVLFKKNIVISGETSSGKTTYLNALAANIPKNERIITLEDTYELSLPHINQVNLLAIKKTERNDPVVSMQDLVQCSLRLRPDRLLMGEIRGREVLDWISACSTGHDGSITTIHAPNPRMAFLRMIGMVRQNNVAGMRDEDIRHLLDEVIDIIVQVRPSHDGRLMSGVYYKGARKGIGA